MRVFFSTLLVAARRPAVSLCAWAGLAAGTFGVMVPAPARAGQAASAAAAAVEPAHSAWLDLRLAAPDSRSTSQTAPAWVETLEPVTRTADGDTPASTVFRVRLRRPPGPGKDLQLRVFFQDAALPADRPRVTAWDELGSPLLDSGPLGEGLDGLANSQALTVPMRGVNYLEITAPGDGSTVRGAFLTWLSRRQMREPVDFPVATAGEPERAGELRILTAARRAAAGGDGFLYGTVTASLQETPMPLTGAGPGSGQPGGLLLEFELEKAPLVGLLSFEVLSGAPVSAAPSVFLNGQALGRADLTLPDLSDPAYQGEAAQSVGVVGPGMAPGEPAPGALTFRYTGWLRGQRIVAAPLLKTGLNRLLIQLSNDTDAAALRAVDLQLKYPWEKLDYVVSPAVR